MFVLFFFCLFASVLANNESCALQSRILYGQDVKIEDYPFYAGLLGCGSAILSDVWILTAAHCVVGLNPGVKNYVYVGGESFRNSIKVPIKKFIVHNDNKIGHLGLPFNDIALIELSKPLKFSKKVNKIKLPNSVATNTKIVFVGRGKDQSGKLSSKLQKVDLVRLSYEQCISLIPDELIQSIETKTLEFLEKTNICAKREANMPTICNGDSGSPLVSGDTLIGLASFIGGKECSELRLGFYVNVQYYVPWIKKITGL